MTGTDIHFSQRAARRVREMLAAKGDAPPLLRVYVEGGGCSGFQYGFAFEEEAADDDIRVETDGVTLLVDPMSSQYLADATVDYIDDLQGSRFLVDNPNANSTCGCGSSFSL